MKLRPTLVIGTGSLVLVSLAAGTIAVQKHKIDLGWNAAHSQFTMPNGWKVTPVGRAVALPGDMPGTIVFDGAGHAVVNTCGYHDHSVSVLDPKTGQVISKSVVPQDWVGMAKVGNEFWVSGGGTKGQMSKKDILRFAMTGGKLVEVGSISLDGVQDDSRFVASILANGDSVYAVNIQTNEVLKLDRSGKVLEKKTVEYRPFHMALSPNKRTLAVTEWGNDSVVLLDPDTLNFRARIKVGLHPTDLAYTPDARLLVTESGSNSVAVIYGSKVSRVVTAVDPTVTVGPLPVSVCVAPDGKLAYVANAGDNAVAVLDLTSQRPKLIGHIPTERYPSVVACTPDGKSLLVGTAKGFYGANAGAGVKLAERRNSHDDPNFTYIGNQLAGSVHVVPLEAGMQLVKWSEMAHANLPSAGRMPVVSATAEADARKAWKKIKHVIYVIKENRTYDQVLGDMPKGNGDPSLVMFGKSVTPNEHAISDQFTLFDNLYTDGECSQVGHQWTDSAHAGDYTEKAWTLSYSKRQEVESDARLTSSPEYLWSLARKNGLWARVYGEYVDVQEDHDALEDPKMKADPEKYGYCAAWEKIFAKGGRDTEKITAFLDELKEFESTGKMPSLMVMALNDDHTRGYRAGAYSPKAMCGANDQAVGMLVEAISRSKFWDSTAIFIIQDDAQNGPDHVDSHRTTGYIVSAYNRRGIVDSTHYTTSSMLKTMETILGLPPMTTYDQQANLMLAPFSSKADLRAFSLLPPETDLDEKNPSGTVLAKESAKLDFSADDKIDPDALNHILWAGLRPGEPYPEGVGQ